jgi:hypothetical protein
VIKPGVSGEWGREGGTSKPKWRVFLVFFLGGLAVSTILFSGMLAWDVVWADLLHDNPNRSKNQALTLLRLSPLEGLIFTFLGSSSANLTAGASAELAFRLYGRVPICWLLGSVPLCALATVVQVHSFTASAEEPASLSRQMMLFSAYHLPGLLGCWSFSRRRSERSPPRRPDEAN